MIRVAIVIAMMIYVRAGREIYKKRQRMVNFSSTGTGTVHGPEPLPVFPEFSSAFNYKTTEVTQTTEIIQGPVPAAQGAPLKDAYSVTISADAQAARELNERASSEDLDVESTATGTATPHPDPNNHDHNGPGTSASSAGNRARVTDSTQISIAPTVTATVAATGNHQDNSNNNTRSRGRRTHHHYESHNATWQYTKCAILFFAVLLITWIPSSGNRVYSLIHRDEMSKPLFFASAFVLPLQGFWNAIIYIMTSWAACKSLWGYLCGLVGGWVHWVRSGRRMSIAEIVDTRTGARRMGGERQGGIGMWAGRKERKEPESTSMEDLTRDGRAT
jgi:hypothetical protein